MTSLFHPYDINKERAINAPLDYNLRADLKHVDGVFKAEISSVRCSYELPAV